MNTTTASQWTEKIIDYVVKNGPGLVGAALVIALGLFAARIVGTLLMRWLEKKQIPVHAVNSADSQGSNRSGNSAPVGFLEAVESREKKTGR